MKNQVKIANITVYPPPKGKKLPSKKKPLKEVKDAIDEFGIEDVEALTEALEPKGYVVSVGIDGEIESINKGGEPTKFSQYQLQGQKENYKEVLVTMPVPKTTYTVLKQGQSYGEFNTREEAKSKA